MNETGRQGVDWADVRTRLGRAIEATERASHPSPERARATLEERARLLARVPKPASSGASMEVLTFAVGRERWAIATRWVRTVMRLTSLTRVSGAPPLLVGITSFRGEVLPVVDLRRVLSDVEPGLADLSRVVVLGVERAELGLLVDEVLAITSLELEHLRPLELPSRPLTERCVRGVTEAAMVVLDGAALLDESTLFMRAQDAGENR